MAVYQKWIIVEPWGIAICVPPKNGTTSITTAITRELSEGDDRLVTGSMSKAADLHDDIRLGDRRDADPYAKLAIVRNPCHRFVSLYNDKVLGGQGCGTVEVRQAVKACTCPEDLVEVIKRFRNVHWVPQAELIGDPENVKLVSLVRFSRWWNERDFTEGVLPMLNVSAQKPGSLHSVNLSNEVSYFLRTRYAEDWRLWNASVV